MSFVYIWSRISRLLTCFRASFFFLLLLFCEHLTIVDWRVSLRNRSPFCRLLCLLAGPLGLFGYVLFLSFSFIVRHTFFFLVSLLLGSICVWHDRSHYHLFALAFASSDLLFPDSKGETEGKWKLFHFRGTYGISPRTGTVCINLEATFESLLRSVSILEVITLRNDDSRKI